MDDESDTTPTLLFGLWQNRHDDDEPSSSKELFDLNEFCPVLDVAVKIEASIRHNFHHMTARLVSPSQQHDLKFEDFFNRPERGENELQGRVLDIVDFIHAGPRRWSRTVGKSPSSSFVEFLRDLYFVKSLDI
jgi:hypothetical protein